MKKFGNMIRGLVLLVSLALVLSYCGSKSSDSGTTDTTTGTASAGAGGSAATSAIQSANLALSATAGSTNAPSFKKAKSLSQAVNGLYSGLRAKRANANALKAKLLASVALSSSDTYTCNGGGTWTMAISTTGTTTTETTTYSNCKQNYSSSVSTVTNGTIVFEDSDQSFTYRLGNATTPYTFKMTQISTGAVLEDMTSTMAYSGASDLASTTTCTVGGTSVTEYTTMTINMDGNMHMKGLDDNESAYDETLVLTAFKLISTSTLNSSTCDITGGTIKESGVVSYTDNLNPAGNESMTISDSNPLTLTWTSVTGGDTYTISGTISVSTQCFTGTLTLATPTAIFIPTNGDCPTAGVVTVSGDVNGTVVYTSTGGVQIKNSSGTIVETYTSCNDVQACI